MKLINTLKTLSALTILNLSAAADPDCNECEKATCETTKCNKSGDSKDTHKATTANSVNLIVTGMTCESCSEKVTQALASVEGVNSQKVCHKSGCVKFNFDPTKTDKATALAAINNTGFKVAGEKLSIPVTGMTCGSCSTKVRTTLENIEGCSDAKVCHKSGHAQVTIDTTKTSSEKVIQAINNTGFKAKQNQDKPLEEVKKSS